MIQLNINPSESHLRQFGAIYFPLFGAAIGGVLIWRHDYWTAAYILWTLAGTSLVITLLNARWIRPLYVGLMVLTFPIGVVVSFLMLALVYYCIFTPIGLIMRLCGKDPMQRRFQPEADTYWQERGEPRPKEHYFRQF